MQKLRTRRPGTTTMSGALAMIALVALAALLLAGLSACGGGSSSSETGTYKYDSGTEKQMAEFTLTLSEGGTYTLAGPNPLGGDDVSITGTYTMDGDKIGLKDEKGVESEAGTVEGDKIVFETVTWVKQ